jgi:SHS2 domain-containing protein
MPEPPFRFEPIEHTADAGIEVRASTRDELFAGAAVALADTVAFVAALEPRLERRVHLEADDTELLLVDFLNELLFLFETEGVLFCEVEVSLSDLGGGRLALDSRLRGEVYDADVRELRTPLKAVTYHGLKVEECGPGWRARVIFDV